LSRNPNPKPRQANRVYYSLSTLLYSSISASRATELETYIRRQALQLPNHMLNLKDWEESLILAKQCRTLEANDRLRDAAFQQAAVKRMFQIATKSLKEASADFSRFQIQVKERLNQQQKFYNNLSKEINKIVASLTKQLKESERKLIQTLMEREKERDNWELLDLSQKIAFDELKKKEKNLIESHTKELLAKALQIKVKD
jgi:hypothetical protein